MANNITVLDGSGNSVVLKTTDNAGVQTPSQNIDALPAAWDGSKVTAVAALGAGGTGLIGWLSAIWDQLKNGTSAVSAASLPLPTGAATAANQATGNTSLGNIDAKLGGTIATSLASQPLPTGASTETTVAAISSRVGPGNDSLDVSNNGTATAHLRKIWTVLNAGFTLGASENHLGSVSGGMAIVRQTVTRQANTLAYASGQLIGANATIGSASNYLALTAARANDKLTQIRRVRLSKTSVTLTAASFRVHFFSKPPTLTVADAGVLSSGSSSTAAGTLAVSANLDRYLGFFDVTCDAAGSAGAIGLGTPAVGSDIMTDPDAGTSVIYAVLEARGAYSPASAEVFTLTLEAWQD